MRPYGIIMVSLVLMFSSMVFPPSECRAADTDAEIQHLKDFIGNSDCTFIRNGAEYGSADALKHIIRKHDATRRWIKTTEDFIRLTATKSSLSGKPYKVRCGDNEMPCADWLNDELARYRNSN